MYLCLLMLTEVAFKFLGHLDKLKVTFLFAIQEPLELCVMTIYIYMEVKIKDHEAF